MVDMKQLNDSLKDSPYIGGFVPSGEDKAVFSSIKDAPKSGEYAHLARWYRHIASFDQKERDSWSSASSSSATPGSTTKPTAAKNEDEDIDLFGSDDEDDEEKARITAERLKAYAEKKANKAGPIAKSNIIFDVKPWDDTVNVEDIEKAVRSIEMDGLIWGGAKKMPVAYGIVKLQIMCVVEDDKVSTDILEEKIMENEELVQSVDIVAFNKI